MEEIEQTEPEAPRKKEEKPDPAQLQREKQLRLGERLMQAREEKELTLAQVSERLRIRKSYLESLEAGDWDSLPEETYVRGFLRQYAQLLKLDIEGELDSLKSDDYRLTKPFTMPDPPIAPSRKWTIAVALVFVLFLVIFNILRETPSHQKVVVPPAPPPAKEATQPAPAATGDAGATTQEAAKPGPASKPGSTPEQAASEPANETAAKPAATNGTAAKAPAVTHQFRFTAVGQSAWIQVFDAHHILLKEALLKPGEELSLGAQAGPLFVTCGNAAALEIRMDGAVVATAGSLGKSGMVLRDHRLDLPTPKP